MTTRILEVSEDNKTFLTDLVAKNNFPSVEAALERAIVLPWQDEAEMEIFVAHPRRGHDQAVRGDFAPRSDQEAVWRAFRGASQAQKAHPEIGRRTFRDRRVRSQ